MNKKMNYIIKNDNNVTGKPIYFNLSRKCFVSDRNLATIFNPSLEGQSVDEINKILKSFNLNLKFKFIEMEEIE